MAEWPDHLQKSFEAALHETRALPAAERWDQVAALVPGKTKVECVTRFRALHAALKAKRDAVMAAKAAKVERDVVISPIAAVPTPSPADTPSLARPAAPAPALPGANGSDKVKPSVGKSSAPKRHDQRNASETGTGGETPSLASQGPEVCSGGASKVEQANGGGHGGGDGEGQAAKGGRKGSGRIGGKGSGKGSGGRSGRSGIAEEEAGGGGKGGAGAEGKDAERGTGGDRVNKRVVVLKEILLKETARAAVARAAARAATPRAATARVAARVVAGAVAATVKG